MINLAGRKDCDLTIIKEIEESGLEFNEMSFKTTGEVESNLFCHFHGWKFERFWYYWVASTDETPLLFKFADKLHETHGKEVRVAGHCGCPSPREWYKQPYQVGVNNYHVDTQEGLNELLRTIQTQTIESVD